MSQYPEQAPVLHMSADQVRTLASAACSEVFSTLSAFEPQSVREVAAAIERSPASVGEQVAKLVEVGLVFKCGERKRRSRLEALYLHRGLVTRFRLEGQPPEVLEAFRRRFSSQLRLAERHHAAFHEALPTDPSLTDYFAYKAYSLKLDRAGALKVQMAIHEVLDLAKALSAALPEGTQDEEVLRMQFVSWLMPTLAASREIRDRKK